MYTHTSTELICRSIFKSQLNNVLKEACPSPTKKLGLKEEMFWDVIRTNDIWWNFEKFVIDRDGHPMYRINPSVWDHGNIVKPLLAEAFAPNTVNGFVQTNSVIRPDSQRRFASFPG